MTYRITRRSSAFLLALVLGVTACGGTAAGVRSPRSQPPPLRRVRLMPWMMRARWRKAIK